MCPPRPAKTPVQALIEATKELERKKKIATLRVKYQFKGRRANKYVWQSVNKVPGSGRVEEITCGVNYFWSGGK